MFLYVWRTTCHQETVLSGSLEELYQLGTRDYVLRSGKDQTYFLDLKSAKTVEYKIAGRSYPTLDIYRCLSHLGTLDSCSTQDEEKIFWEVSYEILTLIFLLSWPMLFLCLFSFWNTWITFSGSRSRRFQSKYSKSIQILSSMFHIDNELHTKFKHIGLKRVSLLASSLLASSLLLARATTLCKTLYEFTKLCG